LFRLSSRSEMPLDQWLSMSEYQQIQPQCRHYHWLSENGSMTRMLASVGHMPLKVDVITSEQQVPNHQERLFLNIAPRKMAYVREVIMYSDDKPWMFGRTIIPAATMNNAGGQLKLLGDKPLGKVLFHHNRNCRQFIQVAQMSNSHPLYPAFLKDVETSRLWARRSLFQFQQAPLLVQEVFLPDCPLTQSV